MGTGQLYPQQNGGREGQGGVPTSCDTPARERASEDIMRHRGHKEQTTAPRAKNSTPQTGRSVVACGCQKTTMVCKGVFCGGAGMRGSSHMNNHKGGAKNPNACRGHITGTSRKIDQFSRRDEGRKTRADTGPRIRVPKNKDKGGARSKKPASV